VIINNIIIEENYSLKGLTTVRVGGLARFFSIANSLSDLISILEWCKSEGFKWFVLGAGSNIIIDDSGFPGVVIKLGKDFHFIEIDDKNRIVKAGSAILLPKLGISLALRGWAGFEYMYGIPGTLGGAVRQNAGTTKEGCIGDNIETVKVLKASMDIKEYRNTDMEFLYRHSVLCSKKEIVLEVCFKLGDKKDIKYMKESITQILNSRRQRQPKNRYNFGSVFKNPNGCKSAGRYIDNLGLKGFRVGDAQVSYEHANWIVNIGNAKSEDVKKLISLIQQKAIQEFGINLQREVLYVPEDVC
jgi:UDP-N-acetylmuramate dehydrogenase